MKLPKQCTNSIRRVISAHPRMFEVIQHVGWNYSDVFETGYYTLLSRYTKNRADGEAPVGSFTLSYLDMIIEDIAHQIEELEETKALLIQTREAQRNFTHIPEGRRELAVMFRDIADKVFSDEEAEGYYQAARNRIEQGRSTENVVSSMFRDIRSRSQGTAIINEIMNLQDGVFRENLIWDWLKNRVSEVNG